MTNDEFRISDFEHEGGEGCQGLWLGNLRHIVGSLRRGCRGRQVFSLAVSMASLGSLGGDSGFVSHCNFVAKRVFGDRSLSGSLKLGFVRREQAAEFVPPRRFFSERFHDKGLTEC
jgi:hypothetical protein